MRGELTAMASRMIGTLAVILVVSAFIGGSDNISNAFKKVTGITPIVYRSTYGEGITPNTN